MDDRRSDSLERWIVYRQLCELLALSRDRPLAEQNDWRWEEIVALASRHLVTPSLVEAVACIPSAPDDLKHYLSEVHAMNARRNAIIADALFALNDTLTREGVRPIYLKGAASLVAGLYDDPGERMIGDVDILVAPEAVDAARRALQGAGYVFALPNRHGEDIADFHHLPMATHPDTGVGVEVHHAMVDLEHRELLPAGAVLARAITVQWRMRDFAVPCATDRTIHNIVHDQLHHIGAERGTGSLRQLRELAILAAREGDRIDWREIETRFAQAGRGDVLAAQATYCRSFMGVALPLREIDEDAAMERRRHGIRRLTAAESALALAMLYARNLRRQPGLVLNLLAPTRWPARIRNWRTHFTRR